MSRITTAFSAALFVVLCLFANAQQPSSPPVPHLIRFSGTIASADGTPRTGVVGVMFSLYTDQQGGTALWTELQNVQLDVNGQYSALLGSQHADGVPAEIFTTNEARWLGIQVEAEPEQPRVLLVSVPYALKAGDAETLGGKPLSAFLLNPNADTTGTSTGTATTTQASASGVQTYSVNTSTSGGTANYVAKWLDAATLGNSALFDNGNVGIGTTSPQALLHVSGALPRTFITATTLGNNAGLQFQALPPNGSAAVRGGLYYAPGNTPDTTFFGMTADDVTYQMVVNQSGNVGIGTSTPQVRLQVTAPQARAFVQSTQAGSNSGMRFEAKSTGAVVSRGGLYYQPGDTTAQTFFGITADDLNYQLIANQAGNVGIGTTTPSQKLSVAGTIQSTTGGFMFPDGSTQTTAPSTTTYAGVGNSNTFGASQTINGDLTLSGSLIIGNKKLILGGFTAPSGGAVQSSLKGDTTGSTGFGFNILDNNGNQAITVDTSGNYGTAVLHAIQSASQLGCGQYCYFANMPAAVRGDAVNTPAGSAAFGVTGTSTSIGVFGNSTGGTGVLGLSTSSTYLAPAIEGYISSTTGNAYAIWGGTASTTGTAGGFDASATSGSTIGVYATAESVNGTAGNFKATAGTGSTGIGLYAATAGDGGTSGTSTAGSFAATSTTGSTWGVYSTTTSPSGHAGDFRNFASSGSTNALYAETDSSSGTAGAFVAPNISGTAWGVWGRVKSPSATAGVFDVPVISGSPTGYVLQGRKCDYTQNPASCTPLFQVDDAGTLFYVNSSMTLSSRRFKTNIQTLTNALDKVQRLRGVSYDRKDDGEHQIGVIAEEVGQVVPEIVSYEANGKDARGVDYTRLTALLIEAVKEQQAKINALEAEVKGLKAKVESKDAGTRVASLK